jgi:battenin
MLAGHIGSLPTALSVYIPCWIASLASFKHNTHLDTLQPLESEPRLTAPGLINNVSCVIILSAALDLVGPSIPKGVVLVSEVIPSFLTKLCAPYFIHKIPYKIRIPVFVALSVCGTLVVALTPPLQDSHTIAIKMFGVVLASLSSGAGELSFLGLTHFFGPFSLAAWGSGTGGAGLIGAGAYAIATNSLGIDPRTSLLAFAVVPFVMLGAFFTVLPQGPLRAEAAKLGGYEAVQSDEQHDGDDIASPVRDAKSTGALQGFKANLLRTRSLFIP